jgi:hypothetical protein
MRGNLLVSLFSHAAMAARRRSVLIHIAVAVGAEEPLAEHMMVADFFRE